MQDAKNLYDVAIVGGGPAGLTAALYLARARYRVLVIEKDKFGGQITITEEVVNYPGVARTSGAALAETMRSQAAAFGAEFMLAEVTALDMEGDVKTVRTTGGNVHALGLLLATGANPRRIGFPGEDEFQGRGVAYCATCDGEFFTDKEVFVVGGGYAAAEESVFLTKYASHVTILMRGDDFSCAKAAAEEARRNPKITVLANTEVVEATGDNALRALRYRNNKTGEEGIYTAPEGDTFGLFVLAGNVPATALLEGIAEVDEAGYVRVDERLHTTAEGLFAAGDVCAKPLRQVVTATGEAALAATELERYVAAMQEKTGLVPKQPSGDAEGAGAASAEGAGANATDVNAASADSDATQTANTYIDADMKAQLDTVFARMENPLTLELALDERPVSNELRALMEELASYTDKLEVRVTDEASSTDSADTPEDDRALTPYVRILRADGADTGLAFHGVPGGHEFTSFVLGLYNAAGPGQPLDDASRKRATEIEDELKLDVLVTLSCPNCPDTVTAAQRIAALNPNVTAHIFDASHFPRLRDKYNAMSVPCLVINGGEQISFGRKNISQVLDLVS